MLRQPIPNKIITNKINQFTLDNYNSNAENVAYLRYYDPVNEYNTIRIEGFLIIRGNYNRGNMSGVSIYNFTAGVNNFENITLLSSSMIDNNHKYLSVEPVKNENLVRIAFSNPNGLTTISVSFISSDMNSGTLKTLVFDKLEHIDLSNMSDFLFLDVNQRAERYVNDNTWTVADLRGEKKLSGNLPYGSIIPIYSDVIPENYLLCDGRSCVDYEINTELGLTNTPDLRGLFIRGVGENSESLGVRQEDAIRNITGTFRVPDRNSTYDKAPTGVFKGSNASGWSAGDASDSTLVTFDASTVVPTADENRPVNMAFNYIIFVGSLKKNLQFNNGNFNIFNTKLSYFYRKEVLKSA